MNGLALRAAPRHLRVEGADRFRSAALSVRRALGLARPTAAAPASALAGRPVVDAAWRPAGTVHDLVLDPETDRILGAVVAHAGPDGEAVLTVVPWAALRFGTTAARVVVLPHVPTASRRADVLGDVDDDRYRRFVAEAGAELCRAGRRPGLRQALGVAAAAAVLLVLAPDALAAAVLGVAGLLLGVATGRQSTVEVLALGDDAPHPTPPAVPRVFDAEFELVGEAVAAPRPRPSLGWDAVAEERRIRPFRVAAGGPADGGRVGALGLEPVGGRVVGWWRGDCYVADPAPADRLAGGDLVAVALWLDASGDALAHLHRAGLLPA